jgi:hypothetical protein
MASSTPEAATCTLPALFLVLLLAATLVPLVLSVAVPTGGLAPPARVVVGLLGVAAARVLMHMLS